jgi:hypothetical protein
MTHPFDGPDLKIHRAHEHLAAIEGEIKRFESLNPYLVTRERDAENLRYLWRFHLTVPVPEILPVLLGDFLFNLHSALDHLAWQLSLLTRPKPYPLTQFPIFSERERIDEAKSKVPHVSDEAWDIIESLQPYHAGDKEAFATPLWMLYELHRIDKHRTLPVVVVQARQLTGVWAASKDFRGLNDGDVILSALIDKTDEGGFEPEFPFRVGVYLDWLFFTAGIEVLINHLYDHVRDRVIPRFSRFFPDPP